MPISLPALVTPQVQTPAPALPARQLDILREQLTGLEAQRTGLQTELASLNQQLKIEKGPFTNTVVQTKVSDVTVAIAHTDGAIAQVRAQIAASQGQTAGTTETPPYKGSINPETVFMGALTLAVPFVIALSIIMVRRFARGGRPPGDTTEVAGRLGRLEQAVDTIAVEVERISEGQRFVTKILADQPAHAASLAGDPNLDREKAR
jgi:hypothetical protein